MALYRLSERLRKWAARVPAAMVLALVALILAMVFSPSARATPLTEVAVPPLTARVTDLTGTLTPDQAAAIEQRLADFENRTGAQFAVLMVATTRPETIEQFGIRVATQWKLGRKNVDDGALLIVAKDDRAARIEVGYGLEGELTDATTYRILSERVIPRFQQQDFGGGVTAGLQAMMDRVDSKAADAGNDVGTADDLSTYGPMILVAALASGLVLRRLMGRAAGSLATGGLTIIAVWWLAGTLSLAIWAGVVATVVAFGGGLNLFGFGRGGRSGGGGGFGGGGASGRW